MIRSVWTIALVVCLSGLSSAAEPDLETPKGTAIAFTKDLEAGNADAARQLAVGSADELKLIEGTTGFIGAIRKFNESATKRFGDQASQITGQNLNLEMSKQLDDAEIKVEGDTATLTNPKVPTQQPMKLHRMDGKWKVDLSTISQNTAMQGQSLPQLLATMKVWSGVFVDLAGEIDQNKYPSVEDARQAFGTRMMAAIAAATPTTAPTSAPAVIAPDATK